MYRDGNIDEARVHVAATEDERAIRAIRELLETIGEELPFDLPPFTKFLEAVKGRVYEF